jgi:hypothetical protein
LFLSHLHTRMLEELKKDMKSQHRLIFPSVLCSLFNDTVSGQYCIYDRTINHYGAVRRTKIVRGSVSIRREPAPEPPFLSQILFDLDWDQTRGAAFGGQ